MEDNMYPTSSERLIESLTSQKKRLKEQQLRYEKERPIISGIKERFEKQIKHYSSVDSYSGDGDMSTFMYEVAVNKKMVKLLRKELTNIERLEVMFAKKDE